jgi:hypothetical protein
MVMEMPSTGRRRAPVAIPTLAPRAPKPAVPTDAASWVRVDVDRYEVRYGGRVIGFVDTIGSVFVVLRGQRYDRAEEVAQCQLFDLAIAMLVSIAEDDSRARAQVS